MLILYCLDNWLTDGGDVVSLTHRPRSTAQKHISLSGTPFCYMLSKTTDLVLPEGLGKLIKLSYRVSNPRPSGM
jgi:hypothetical protein